MKKERTKKRGSLMFRTWLYFMALTVFMLAFLWGGEIIVFKTMYQRMKTNEVKSVTHYLADKYGSEDDAEFFDRVDNAVSTNQLMFAMFTLDGKSPSQASASDVKLIYYRDFVGHQETSDKTGSVEFVPDDDFFITIKKENEIYSYQTSQGFNREASLVVSTSRVHDGETIYFYISSVNEPMNITTMLLADQLITVTCICLIVSVILSFALSRNITKPLTQFARTAKLMGNGQKVEFVASGYEEFDELAKTLTTASEEIEKTEKLRRDFMANVSHDLRTPLTIVKAYTERIRDISYRDEQKRNEHCKVIIDEVDRLALLVNDILDLSKIQSGTRAPEKNGCNLGAVAMRVMERFEIYREQGYNFVIETDEDCVCECDERMLEQVFYNLIGNAVSYTGEDKKVAVRVKKQDGRARVEISDTGKGIAPSEKDKVWDRYYRASQSKRAVVGSGIGLSIVKSVLIAHDAEYGIESVVNNGSTFWFALPLASPRTAD